jgi:putative pre-16S rRNA nuclease
MRRTRWNAVRTGLCCVGPAAPDAQPWAAMLRASRPLTSHVPRPTSHGPRPTRYPQSVTEEHGPGRLLGVDFGERRIGVAVSEGRLAVPLTIVEHVDRQRDLERIASLAREHVVDSVIVGLPMLESGEEGEQARRSRRFGDALARLIGIPVLYHDERLSTFTAEEAARELPVKHGRATHIDDIAATVILQSYIDTTAGPAPRMPDATP